MKLVHWPLVGGLLHLVQRGWDWAGIQEVVVVVVVVEIFIHNAVKAIVTNAPQSQLNMSLQQFLELADCRVGLTQ